MEFLNIVVAMIAVFSYYSHKRQAESADYLKQMVNMMIHKHELDRTRVEQVMGEMSTLRKEVVALRRVADEHSRVFLTDRSSIDAMDVFSDD